jgi:hypothetical protein
VLGHLNPLLLQSNLQAHETPKFRRRNTARHWSGPSVRAGAAASQAAHSRRPTCSSMSLPCASPSALYKKEAGGLVLLLSALLRQQQALEEQPQMPVQSMPTNSNWVWPRARDFTAFACFL